VMVRVRLRAGERVRVKVRVRLRASERGGEARRAASFAMALASWSGVG
jgi:hypothetical protein